MKFSMICIFSLPEVDAGLLCSVFAFGCCAIALAWGMHFRKTVYELKNVIIFILVDLVMVALFFVKFGHMR